MDEHKIEQINRQFYDDLYRERHPFFHLLHSIISFDQQGKSKPNWLYLRRFVNNSQSLRLLDYGSGWGTFLLKIPSSIEAYCFDISLGSMKMLQKAHNLLGRNVHIASLEQNVILPGQFDIIVCSHVLEHVPDESELLQKFYNSLNVHGLLLLNVPINETWHDPKHIRTYTISSLQQAVEEAGFKAILIQEVDKWSGFLLERELDFENITTIKKTSLRFLRAILALLPYRMVRWSERLFVSRRNFQQVIIIGEKV